MSIFASDVTKQLAVPGASGQSITIRKLVKGQLKKAAKASQKAAMAEYFDISDEDRARIEAINAKKDDPKKPDEAEKVDPILLYDHPTLMVEAVTAWTLGKPIAADTFADLDDDVSDWLAKEILLLSKPSLFDNAEAAQKNG